MGSQEFLVPFDEQIVLCLNNRNNFYRINKYYSLILTFLLFAMLYAIAYREEFLNKLER